VGLLVRDAAQREVGQVLDRKVSLVDEEAESVLVGLRDDLAEGVFRPLPIAAARAQEASEIKRGGIEAGTAVDRGERGFGRGQVLSLVGDLAAQIRQLVITIARQRVFGGERLQIGRASCRERV